MSGRKSTIKDKWIGCNPKNHLKVGKWHEMTSSLDPTGLGGKKKERKRKKELLEREALTSL